MSSIPTVSAAATIAAMRHCSPVVRPMAKSRAVAMLRTGGRVRIAFADVRVAALDYRSAADAVDAGWRIDPTEATGRAHLAWSVSQAMPPTDTRHGALLLWLMMPCWSVPDAASERLRTRAWGFLWPCGEDLVMRQLDPATLPDGSRVVDAIALVRTANHVAEVSDAET
jgi:hypothetical protein